MSKKGLINITGAAESRVAPLMGRILQQEAKGQCLVVASSYVRAQRLATDLSFFVDKTIYVLPPEEEVFVRSVARSENSLCMNTLKRRCCVWQGAWKSN